MKHDEERIKNLELRMEKILQQQALILDRFSLLVKMIEQSSDVKCPSCDEKMHKIIGTFPYNSEHWECLKCGEVLA
jgi:hypothetical protein